MLGNKDIKQIIHRHRAKAAANDIAYRSKSFIAICNSIYNQQQKHGTAKKCKMHPKTV